MRAKILGVCAALSCTASEPGNDGPSGDEATSAAADSGSSDATLDDSADVDVNDDDGSTDDGMPDDGGSTDGGPTTTDGGGGLPDCSLDPSAPFEPEGLVVQLQSADGSICARLERRNDGPGNNANVAFTLIDVMVGELGSVAHVEDEAALCYYASHHNFLDWAHIWTGTEHVDIQLIEDGHGGPRRYEMHRFSGDALTGPPCAPFAEGSDPIGEPIELFGVGV